MRRKKKKAGRDSASAERIQKAGDRFFLDSPRQSHIAKLAEEYEGAELKSAGELDDRLKPWGKIDLFWMLRPEEQEDILGLVPQKGVLTRLEQGTISRMSKTRLFDMLPEKEKKFVLTTHGWYDPNAWKKLMAGANTEKEF